MRPNGLALKDLVDLADWQKIQEHFSEVIGITLRTIDLKGTLLTGISGPTQICNLITPKMSKYADFCGICSLKAKRRHKLNIEEAANLKCPFDLDIFVLSIKAFGNRIVAYIIVGPIIIQNRKAVSEYAMHAQKAGIGLEELMDALIEINVFSHSKIHSTNKLLSDIFSYMAQTGYHKKRLGEITKEVTVMDPYLSRQYEEKILSTLLNICTVAFNADSGSVMTVDKKTEHLHIKVASKLDKDIIEDTDIKVGEGIAGIAAATAKPIILPKDRYKNGLSKKMKRKYIKSSMIVPFNREENGDVYGVINLNIVRKNKEFSAKDISFVKELVNLASIALAPVQ